MANAPTLANLASNTTKLPSYDGVAPTIVNSSRDAAVVFATDTPAVDDDFDDEPSDEGNETPAEPVDSAQATAAGPDQDGRPGRRASRRPELHGGRRDEDPGRPADQGAARPDRQRRHDRGAVRRRLLAAQPAARRPRGRALARCHRRCGRGRLERPGRHGDQAGAHLQRVRPGAHRGDQREPAQVRRCGRQQAGRHRRPRQGHLAARPGLGQPRAGRARRGPPRRVLDPRRRPRLRHRPERPELRRRPRRPGGRQGAGRAGRPARRPVVATARWSTPPRSTRSPRRSPARTVCSPRPRVTCSASSACPSRSRRSPTTSTPSSCSSSSPSWAPTGPARWRRPSTSVAPYSWTTGGPRSARTSPASGSVTRRPASTASSASTPPPRRRPAGGWTAPSARSARTWSPSTAMP